MLAGTAILLISCGMGAVVRSSITKNKRGAIIKLSQMFLYPLPLHENMGIPVALFRLIIIFLMAIIFGIERQRTHKPIGFGTFIFVSLGACALAIAATDLYPENPLPLLSGVITGIGFLGAGALIKTTDKIFGFTTAASIWLFAILGVVIGIGEYFLGISIYVGVWIVILFDRYLESRGIGSYQKKIIVHANAMVPEKEISSLLLLTTKKFKLISTEFDKKNSRLALTYLIEGIKEFLNKIPKALWGKEWFESCKVE